uniref:Transmembrane protein 272 n=1 Tax=Catagonus wagneri TaxID=51154 RepID=A0A8C3VSF9_9CETA
MPGGVKACHRYISKIASNGVSPAVRLHQDDAASVQGCGD